MSTSGGPPEIGSQLFAFLSLIAFEQSMTSSRQRKLEVELHVGVRDREAVRYGLGAVNVESAPVENLLAIVPH